MGQVHLTVPGTWHGACASKGGTSLTCARSHAPPLGQPWTIDKGRPAFPRERPPAIGVSTSVSLAASVTLTLESPASCRAVCLGAP